MSFQKHFFEDGQVLNAKDLNEIEEGIEQIEKQIEELKENNALVGPPGPKGDKGDKGDAYILTEVDKNEMVNAVIALLPVYGGEIE